MSRIINMARRRRGARMVAAMAVLVGTFAVANQSATAESPRMQHCVAPDGVDVPAGTDLNALFGESATIVSHFYGCDTARTGSPWTAILGFYFAKSWLQIPPGYVPAAATPREDFLTKLVAFRFVVDQGTPQEFSAVFPMGPKIWIGDINGFDPSIGDYSQYDWVQGMTLVTMRPLSAGLHTVQKFVILSDVQCDGNFSDYNLSCLPAGETQIGGGQFSWVSR